jgi:hypothetical protein
LQNTALKLDGKLNSKKIEMSPFQNPFISRLINLIDFWCFNATFNNISATSWRPVLVVGEAGVPEENHRPWVSNWYTLSLAAASRVHPFL